MTRNLVTLRDVALDDAAELSRLWGEFIRRGEGRDAVADMRTIIDQVLTRIDERLVVAEYDGVLAGAVLLRVAPLTPLHLEPIVQVISPHVFAEYRRRGVGRALMEAASAFAEDRGIHHIGTASMSNSREANRFMARLGLSPHATLRVTSTQMLRAKLTGQRATFPRQAGRPMGQILAARRSLRRAQSFAASVD
jgi:ribosomal protein S18 acetylase RimI-like enzyme